MPETEDIAEVLGPGYEDMVNMNIDNARRDIEKLGKSIVNCDIKPSTFYTFRSILINTKHIKLDAIKLSPKKALEYSNEADKLEREALEIIRQTIPKCECKLKK